MKFSENWLRTLVDPPLSTDQLAQLLTMSGLEVEACESVAPPFSGVVVAEVQAVQRHPNADRLSVCQVNAGTGAMLSIVCGAPNVTPGMKVPCALVGATLPRETAGGETAGQTFAIRLTQMRGVESQGMLCSARELGLSDDHSGLLSLPADATVGMDYRAYAELDDALFTIKLTPNRADCLSIAGVAREVAALTDSPLHEAPTVPVEPHSGASLPVTISAPEGCGRFTGRVIENVDAAATTPPWMQQRLERAGQRCISALVDITNYVMLELGCPLHVYDLDKLQGGIDVRFGRPGETLKLLNEQTVELDEDVLAITDRSGIIGLAGIMGGDGTKADLQTRHIFLESAFFFPDAIAGRARRYNFLSDAAHRFERGVDFNNNVTGIERATALVLEICGGEAGPVTDQIARLPERKPVRMRVARARKVIGMDIGAEQMAAIFGRLGLTFLHEEHGEGGETFVVTPPSYRFDLELEEDLIEEVARLYGYENIPALPPMARAAMRVMPEARRSLHDLRERLAAADYQETLNYSFVEESWEADFADNHQPIRLKNPIASQMSVMRSQLIGGLVANLRFNLNRKLGRIRVFEVGRVFLSAPGAPVDDLEVAGYRQPTHIAALAFGPALDEQWGVADRPVDFFDVKADLLRLLPRAPRLVAAAHPALHPGRSARIEVEGQAIGWIGELHPRWQQKYELPPAPVIFEMNVAPLLDVPVPVTSSVSRFPSVRRDFAVVLDERVALQEVYDVLNGQLPAFITDIAVFDIYRGKGIEEGKKSLAFRVLMQDTEKTLQDGEVDAAMQKIIAVVTSRLGGKLRS